MTLGQEGRVKSEQQIDLAWELVHKVTNWFCSVQNWHLLEVD